MVDDVLRQVSAAWFEVPVNDIAVTGSPRLEGESDDHVRVLAESGAVLPPIIVHRSTMRVIDGAHRLKVARDRGDERIKVRFFDGSERDAFVLAVHVLAEFLAVNRSAAAAAESSCRWGRAHCSG